ncbi:Uncharacterised protein [BD1-7 clade bacterium]|uniref:Uncharacterized protein n=1 Tax=BD1-7 clade bacterium TaxID=2029982 RepID=A0A5S9QSL6_9GAMM|nr:Uncharacterised protein [BD1-7 clade bacterium]
MWLVSCRAVLQATNSTFGSAKSSVDYSTGKLRKPCLDKGYSVLRAD